MPNEENFSEKESLKLITEMINKSKESFHDSGFGPIMWGSVILFCALFTFCQVQFSFETGFDIWFLAFAAVVPQIIYSIREGKKKNAKTYNDIAMDYTWIGFGICIFLLAFWTGAVDAAINENHLEFKNNSGAFHLYNYSTTLYLMLYGLPTFITGGIMKFKPMLFGGILFWVFGFISIYTDIKTDMLLIAAGSLAGWLIPGILLYRGYCKNKKANV
jgi:hypothetical protein